MHCHICGFAVVCWLLLSATIGSCDQSSSKLKGIWLQFPPCQAIQNLVKLYDKATVEIDCPEFSSWYTDAFNALKGEQNYDFAILDSQWLGEAVQEGYLLELTDVYNTLIDVNDYLPETIESYGEYPRKSGRYWGVPFYPDVQLLFYRRDIWKTLGIDEILSLTQLLEVSRYINQANDSILHTAEGGRIRAFSTTWCGDSNLCYDSLASFWNQIAWSFGGQIWDESTYKIEGILDSEENVKALQYAKELLDEGLKDSINKTLGTTLDDICQGRVAMAALWSSFALLDPSWCPHAENISFTVFPGEKVHRLTLGGQGLHVVKHSSNITATLDFVSWLCSQSTQKEWALKRGYLSNLKSVTASGSFLNRNKFNPVFVVSYQIAEDFWRLPEYFTLLEIHSAYLWKALKGELDAFTALELAAEEQNTLVSLNHPYGPYKLKPLDPPLRWFFFVLAVILSLVSVVYIVLTIIYCGASQIKHSSTLFLFLLLFSSLLAYMTVFVLTSYPPNSVTCILSLWTGHLSFAIAYGGILIKSFRIWIIFRRVKLMDLREHKDLKDSHLLRWLIAYILIYVILLLAFTFVEPTQPAVLPMSEKINEIMIYCSSPSYGCITSLFVFEAITLLFGVFLCFKTRKVSFGKNNEVVPLAICIYTLFVMAFLFVPVSFYIPDPNITFLVQAGGILVATAVTIQAQFLPKFISISKGVKSVDKSVTRSQEKVAS